MAPDAPAPQNAAGLEVIDRPGERVLAFRGTLDSLHVAEIWGPALRAAREPDRPLVLDLAAVVYCDTTGAALLLDAERVHGAPARVVGAAEKVAALLSGLVRPPWRSPAHRRPPRPGAKPPPACCASAPAALPS